MTPEFVSLRIDASASQCALWLTTVQAFGHISSYIHLISCWFQTQFSVNFYSSCFTVFCVLCHSLLCVLCHYILCTMSLYFVYYVTLFCVLCHSILCNMSLYLVYYATLFRVLCHSLPCVLCHSILWTMSLRFVFSLEPTEDFPQAIVM